MVSSSPGHATCRRESEEGEAGRVEERRLRESSHWSTKNRREGSGSGYKIQGGEKEHIQYMLKVIPQTGDLSFRWFDCLVAESMWLIKAGLPDSQKQMSFIYGSHLLLACPVSTARLALEHISELGASVKPWGTLAWCSYWVHPRQVTLASHWPFLTYAGISPWRRYLMAILVLS